MNKYWGIQVGGSKVLPATTLVLEVRITIFTHPPGRFSTVVLGHMHMNLCFHIILGTTVAVQFGGGQFSITLSVILCLKYVHFVNIIWVEVLVN